MAEIVMYEGYGAPSGSGSAKVRANRKRFGTCSRSCLKGSDTFKDMGKCMRSCLGGGRKRKGKKR